jgi:DNA repair exonuclease SbcCD ATPase subunit
MNIYQNGEFSKNLHKLTKYQSLAATVNDMSKQSLYAKKVEEYRNKLDKVSGVQTGGTSKADVMSKIRSTLVPNVWRTKYEELVTAHGQLTAAISSLQPLVTTKLEDLRRAMREAENTNATQQRLLELGQGQPAAAAQSQEVGRLQTELNTLGARLDAARAAGDQNQVALLQGELSTLRTSHDAALAALRGKLDELSKSNAALKGELDNFKEKAGRVRQLQGEVEELEKQLKAARAQQSMPADCKEQINTMLKEINDDIDTYNRDSNRPNDPNNITGPTQAALDALKALVQ